MTNDFLLVLFVSGKQKQFNGFQSCAGEESIKHDYRVFSALKCEAKACSVCSSFAFCSQWFSSFFVQLLLLLCVGVIHLLIYFKPLCFLDTDRVWVDGKSISHSDMCARA